MNAPCGECGRVNPTSPSDDFCSDVCQQHWHARRTIGYPMVTDIAPPSQLAAVAGRWRAA